MSAGVTMSLVRRLMQSAARERGASIIEYALLLIFIAIVAFVGVSLAGQSTSEAFSSVAASLGN